MTAQWPGAVVADSLDQLANTQKPPPAATPANEQTPAAATPTGGAGFPGEVVPPDKAQLMEGDRIGGFADELPEGSAVDDEMDPAVRAETVRILAESPVDTAASEARQYLAQHGHAGGSDNFDEVVDFRRKHGVVGKDLTLKVPDVSPDDGRAGALARGIADTPTFGTIDELVGLGQGVKKAVTGQQSEEGFWHDVHMATDYYRGFVKKDEAEHPVTRIAGQLFGGAAIPIGYEGVGVKAGTEAMRVARAGGATTQEALQLGRKAASTAVTKAMARDGVIIGGAHGVGSGEGVEGRVGEGLLEAGLGGVGGAAAGKVAEVAAPRIVASRAAQRAAPLTEEQEMVRAADRQGVDLIPADTGGPMVRRATGMITQTIAGGQPVIKASQRMTEQAKTARDRIAESIGTALQPEAAGQQAISGAQKAIRSTADEARVFYSRAEKEAAGVKIQAPKAVEALDRNIAELAETPGGAPGLSTLQDLRDALAKGDLSVSGIRRMRTVLRDQFLKEGLTGSDLERRVNQVVDAAAEDVRDGLSAAGKPDAAASFAQGDAAWKSRAKLIDDTFEPILGKKGQKSGEQVIKTLTADLQGNNARAVRFLKALPPGEQANIRASIIGALGRAKAGKQGSEGEDFSLDTFLTNWNQVGETAKAAYFGPESRAALNDLAKIAEGTREAQGYRNMSNTGGVVGNLLTLFSGVGGPLAFAKVVGSQYAVGRLLASPRYARWLARAPKAKNPQAYVRKLSSIAKSEPAIAGDVLALQRRLEDAFRTQPVPLAAENKTDSEQTPQ